MYGNISIIVDGNINIKLQSKNVGKTAARYLCAIAYSQAHWRVKLYIALIKYLQIIYDFICTL